MSVQPSYISTMESKKNLSRRALEDNPTTSTAAAYTTSVPTRSGSASVMNPPNSYLGVHAT